MSSLSPYGGQEPTSIINVTSDEMVSYKNVDFQVPDALIALGHRMAGLFCMYKSARRPYELEWVRYYNQFNGYYDDDIIIPPGRSRIYPMETFLRVSIVHARLMDLLFPNSKSKNWSLQATMQPDLPDDKIQQLYAIGLEAGLAEPNQFETLVAEYAAARVLRLEHTIEDQLQDIDYRDMVSRILWDFLIYGKGVAKGAAYYAKKSLTWTANGPVKNTVLYPEVSFVNIWDFFPDVSAIELKQCNGIFQRYILARHDVEALAHKPGFFTGRIMQYLATNPNGNYTEHDYEQHIRNARFSYTVERPAITERYEIVEYWGRITGKELHACGCYDIPEILHGASFMVNIWVLDNKVIRLPTDLLPPDTEMFHAADFMENRSHMFSHGFVKIQEHNQRALSAIARQLLDNAAAVSGPTTEVNLDMLDEDSRTNLDHSPFKVYKRSGFGNDAATPAVRNISIDSHINELVTLYGLFKNNLTEETSTPPSTAFLNGGEALRTSHNMSAAIGATSVTLRGIVERFDKFTKSIVEAFIKWNNAYNPDESIRGDAKVITTGAVNMVTKEAKIEALARFKQTISEAQSDYINWHALTEAERDVMELDKHFVVPEQVAEQAQANRQAAANEVAKVEAEKLVSETKLNEASIAEKQAALMQARENMRLKIAETTARISNMVVDNQMKQDDGKVKKLTTAVDVAQKLNQNGTAQ